MATTVYDKYREAEILDADPIKLVNMLYRGAIEAVVSARKHLAGGAIRARSKDIVKAWEIVHELNQSLDHTQGGELSKNLSGLYVYMQTRLMEANSLQSDVPLQEVESLLRTLEEGWQKVPPPAPLMSDPQGEHQPLSLTY
jgi:flagellar secretion chaperone FliS